MVQHWRELVASRSVPGARQLATVLFGLVCPEVHARACPDRLGGQCADLKLIEVIEEIIQLQPAATEPVSSAEVPPALLGLRSYGRRCG